MPPLPFLDTNVVLRHLLGDHPDHSPRATALIERIEQGQLRARIADTVVFETVFFLEHSLKQSKGRVRDALIGLLDIPGIVLPGKRRMRCVLALYAEQNIPFVDAYHCELMVDLGLDEMISFDHHHDRVPGLRRVEP